MWFRKFRHLEGNNSNLVRREISCWETSTREFPRKEHVDFRIVWNQVFVSFAWKIKRPFSSCLVDIFVSAGTAHHWVTWQIVHCVGSWLRIGLRFSHDDYGILFLYFVCVKISARLLIYLYINRTKHRSVYMAWGPRNRWVYAATLCDLHTLYLYE